MIKLATYKIFKNKETGEVKHIPLGEYEEEGAVKLASSEWEDITEEVSSDAE